MEPKLISYTIVDFRSKQDLELFLRRWEDRKDTWLKKFKDSGMLSNINTQIWDKDNIFRLGRIFTYKDD